MINAVIIEDEPLLGKNLELMIKEYCPDINIVALVDSGNMALEVLPSLQYDLVFSDIELGGARLVLYFGDLDPRGVLIPQEALFLLPHTMNLH